MQVVDHGAAGQAAGDAGSGQSHGGGRLAQVVPGGAEAVHVAAAGAQAARHPPDAAFADTGVVPGVGYRCRIYGGDDTGIIQCMNNN